MTAITKYEKVGVGVTILLTWGNRLLLAKRKGSHGEGTWDTPGGHIEPGESVEACAIRETLEETNIQINADIKEIGYTEDFFELEKKHYITCVVRVDIDGSLVTPRIIEPEKFSTEWAWYDISQLPDPLFIPVKNAIQKFYDMNNQRNS